MLEEQNNLQKWLKENESECPDAVGLRGRVCNHLQAVIALVEHHRRCRLLHPREVLSEN